MTGAMRSWLVMALLGLGSGCAHAGSSSARAPGGREGQRDSAPQPTLSTCGAAIDWRADPALAGEDDAASQIPGLRTLRAPSRRNGTWAFFGKL